MKINVNVKIDHDKIAKIQKARNDAIYKTAEAILSDIHSRGVVPKDTGILEESGFDELYGVNQVAKILSARIVFDTPYARRWYFNVENVTFQKTKNPNAQDHWMDYYLDGEGLQFVIDTYTKFFKELAGL